MKKQTCCALLLLLTALLGGCGVSDGFARTENGAYAGQEAETEQSADFLGAVPAYSGEPYVVLEDNCPDFSEEEKACTDAFESYSELDGLGRCGQAYANVCRELAPAGERGSIGSVRPSGWHTVKYGDLIEDNYLYNRCHLIAFQLAGENANEKNLITGTRYLNVKGMLPFENQVAEYLEAEDNHVLYRVTPVFEGENLVASGVRMEAWSVEDQGAGVCFHVYCYNVQPGIAIDYATGESCESGDTLFEAGTDAGLDSAGDTDTEVQSFVLNTSTKRFHLPSCKSVREMAEQNKEACTGTKEELIGMGYQPCQRCLGNSE